MQKIIFTKKLTTTQHLSSKSINLQFSHSKPNHNFN